MSGFTLVSTYPSLSLSSRHSLFASLFLSLLLLLLLSPPYPRLHYDGEVLVTLGRKLCCNLGRGRERIRMGKREREKCTEKWISAKSLTHVYTPNVHNLSFFLSLSLSLSIYLSHFLHFSFFFPTLACSLTALILRPNSSMAVRSD